MAGLLSRIREQAAPFYGLAAALGIGLPLLLGVVTGQMDRATLAGIGAFLLAFTAPSGPYGARARSLAVSIAVIAAGGALGGLLAGHRWATVAVIAAVVPAAVSVSWMRPTAVMAVLLTAVRPPPGHPLENALFMALGGLWLALLLLIPWPARRLRPLREALGGAAGAIAALLDVVAGELENPARTDADQAADTTRWDRCHKQAVAAVRDAATTHRLYRSGGEEERRGTQPQQLIDTFYRMIRTTVGLHEQIQSLTAHPPMPGTTPDPWRSGAHEAVAALADRARLLSETLAGARPAGAGGEPPIQAEPFTGAGAVRDGHRDREGLIHAAIAGQISRSIDRLDSILRSARHILGDGLRTGLPAHRPRPPPAVDPAGVAAALVRAVRDRSPLFRHATRVAVLVTAAMSISTALRLTHGQWLPVTVLLSLRDTYGQTMSRVGQRVAGGVAGSAIAAVVLALAPSRPHIVLLMTVFAAAGFGLRSMSYTFWSVCSTPLLMMLMDLTRLSDWDAALQRIAMVAAGGGIAVVGARVLWPRAAGQQIPARTAELLSANAELTRAAASVVDGQTAHLPGDRLAAADAAVNNVADLRSRLENEPSHDPGRADRLDRLDTVVRASRHLRDRLIAVADTSRENFGEDDPIARILDRVADGIERAAVSDDAAPGDSGPAGRLDLTDQFAALDVQITSLTRDGRGEDGLTDERLRRLAPAPHTLGALVDDANELISAAGLVR